MVFDGGGCVDPSPARSPLEEQLVALPADSWFQIPNSKIRPLCPMGQQGNCASVIGAWSGGAWDPVHNRFLVFGGGHGDYSGNELYALELGTGTWSILSQPSSPTQRSQDPLPDGKPVSRHSYDGLQYLTHANRFFAHGGSRWQDGSGTSVTWLFESETGTWTNRMPTVANRFTGCCSEATAYDPVTRRVYAHNSDFLRAWDEPTNAWVTLKNLGFPPEWPRYATGGEPRGVIDPSRRLLWFLGGRHLSTWDLRAGAYVTDAWITTGGATFTNAADVQNRMGQVITTGGGEIITAQGPGIDYDPTADAFVAWRGGAPWVLDLPTKTWSQRSATGAPPMPASRGTYGRWRYVSRVNAFLLVNSIDEDVWVYKHTPRCGN